MYDAAQILKLATAYENGCSLIKIARIKKMPDGKYRVVSQKGKNLGTYDSREGAEKRLKQVEFFKHVDKSKADDDTEVIDLMGAVDFSYSAIMREMRQNASKEQFTTFLQLYKKYFDKAVKAKLQKPEKVALQDSLIKFNKLHKIKVKKKLVKNAAVSELGDPVLVGKYLADIVRFTLNRLPEDKRAKAVESLRQKFYTFNANEIAQKKMPETASIGQSITFVKHVLFNHDAHYVREVINNLVRHL
jgi:hypothetical protein